MTKSTITRERLEWLSQISCRDDIGDIGGDEIRELASIALAAMDSEPVAYGLIFRNMDGVLNNYINTNTVFATREKAEGYGKGGNYEERSDGGLEWVPNAALDPVVIPLYSHAQQPVVPDEIKKRLPEIMRTGKANRWEIHDLAKICAMLAAAPHDTPALNSVQSVVTVPGKWIPVSERMPERGDYLVTDGCDFDVQLFNGEQFIPGFVWEDKITHWMQLPVAPQEVK